MRLHHDHTKVKQSLAWTFLGVPGGWGSQISWQSANEGGKVVSSTHRPPLPPRNISGAHFCQRLSRFQGHNTAGRKMSSTPSGIETATFRLVAQCLNQLHHRVSHHDHGLVKIYGKIMPWYETVCHSEVRKQNVQGNSKLLHKNGFICNLFSP